MKLSFLRRFIGRKQGLALVIVISALALISILIVAIFSLTRREFKATQGYVSGKTAKQLADVAAAIVESQIQKGQAQTTQGTFHATQPGMVRVYNANGGFAAAYKLYSSTQMSVNGGQESALYAADHVAPTNWNTQPDRYVDLNEPVIRPGRITAAADASAGFTIYYPIIDPRAAFNFYGDQGVGPSGGTNTSQVEGFTYGQSTALLGSGNQTYNTVVTPDAAGGDATLLRLPMPVEWMYVLQDGTLGFLNEGNSFVSSNPGSEPSVTNPIVGRIAFWTDDESCKININTAGEPTYLSSPFFFHERDARWAHFPGTTGEYQRYPGHPATVALSSVFAPNYILDPYFPNRDRGGLNQQQIVDLKHRIYDLVPKIARGGSEAGTRPFVRDDFSDEENEGSAATRIDLTASLRERLLASVDEMLFHDSNYDAQSGRAPARFAMPGNPGRLLFDNNTLERSRGFLTAHSRSPDFTLHGLPRVCMWPVADESLGGSTNNPYRTTFDNMIALCGTIRGASSAGGSDRTYFFRRAQSYSSTFDLTGSQTLQRNEQLLDYLVDQMSQITWPATSTLSGSGASFSQKYGSDNVNQLAIQFFDYIRSTNLYDGMLARKNDAWNFRSSNTRQRYFDRDSSRAENYTYTAQRVTEPPNTINNATQELGAGNRRANASGGVLPGHGQVSPALWNKGGRTYKGFGRMFTISEIGFHFICTADGKPDTQSLTTFSPPTEAGRGGGTAPRYFPTDDYSGGGYRVLPNSDAYPNMRVDGGDGRWYSNFPPILPGSEQQMMEFYGCQAIEGSDSHPSRHPGFNPENWNYSLPANTPLQVDQKRVQVALIFEAFCPSQGWTSFYPEFTMVLDGDTVAQCKLEGQSLFNTTGDVPIKSNGNIYDAFGSYPVGGHAGPTALASGRRTRSIQQGGGQVLMSVDEGYDNNNTSGHEALNNFALVSDFVTVNRNSPMQFTFPNEDLEIKIYDTHMWENAVPVQIIKVNFGQMGLDPTIPMPHLVGSDNPLPDGRQGGKYVGGPRNTTDTGAVTTGQHFSRTDSNGRLRLWRSLQGPHWWGYSHGGVLHRAEGRVNTNHTTSNGEPFWTVNPTPIQPGQQDDADRQTKRGRLDTQATGVGIQTPEGGAWQNFSIIADDTSDVIRSIVPAIGDYRTLAAMYTVPTSVWMPHPLWRSDLSAIRQAHSFSNYWADNEGGASFGVNIQSMADALAFEGDAYGTVYNMASQMVGGAGYQLDSRANQINNRMTSRHADLPPSMEWARAANAFGDFDSGLASAREGPYINKPDEGNFYASEELRNNVRHFERSAYFREQWENADDWRSGIYMTPNRLIASPVMFGSLPTGVYGAGNGLPNAASIAGLGGQEYAPWQTLLFRPHAQVNNAEPASSNTHPGTHDPSDHYLLDMFFMPVVEPYAISEPLSTAGRINMNYQMMPFTHIRRATGMHAVLKGEFITAIPNDQITQAKGYRPRNGGTAWDDTFWSDSEDSKQWHRPVDAAATLAQFDMRFKHTSGNPENAEGLFRSATQICDVHLIPYDGDGGGISNAGSSSVTLRNETSQSSFDNAMNQFWGNNRPTGENIRERNYSNIYARVTTRTNTFRVHMRAQVVKKARSTPVDQFDSTRDAIVSEYRGSTLIERYIDPNDATGIPDYASGGPYSGGKPPLDAFFRYRVLETKRFAP